MGTLLPFHTLKGPPRECIMAEPTEATLPFGMGSVDLTSPMAVLAMVVSLIFGFTIFNMTGSIGEYLAQRANSIVGSVLGFNPASGESDGVDLV
jgi:ABC-type amino acid transport system permease subunit